MKTKDVQELYQIKLHSMDTILHQISLMDQVENEQELSEMQILPERYAYSEISGTSILI